jgi:hypothetical protein
MKTEKPKVVIIQGRRYGGQAGIDARNLLFWILRSWNLSLKDDCLFEFIFDGPQRAIPTRKVERREVLAPHVAALCERLRALPQFSPEPTFLAEKLANHHQIYGKFENDGIEGKPPDGNKVRALRKLLKEYIDYRDSIDESNEELAECESLIHTAEKGLERYESLISKDSRRLIQLPTKGVIGLGDLACECLTGDSFLSRRAGAYWRLLPEFQRVGVHKAFIARDSLACLYAPDLMVDLSGMIYLITCELGIPTKINNELRIPSCWVDYADAAYEKRAKQQVGL